MLRMREKKEMILVLFPIRHRWFSLVEKNIHDEINHWFFSLYYTMMFGIRWCTIECIRLNKRVGHCSHYQPLVPIYRKKRKGGRDFMRNQCEWSAQDDDA